MTTNLTVFDNHRNRVYTFLVATLRIARNARDILL